MDAVPVEPDFTVVDLLGDIRRRHEIEVGRAGAAEPDKDGIYTTKELSKRLEMSVDRVREELHWYDEQDRLQQVKKSIKVLGSRRTMKVDAYRLLPPPDEQQDQGQEEQQG